MTVIVGVLQVREGMVKGSASRPGHSKWEMNWDTECLRTVDMGETGRVHNDGIAAIGTFERGFGSMHDCQQPSKISAIVA